MYALTIVETTSFNQANLLRIMMEGEGCPAVAATVKIDDKEEHMCLTSAPRGVAEMLNLLARAFGDEPGALQRAMDTAMSRLQRPGVARLPDPLRTAVRGAIKATIIGACGDTNGTLVRSLSGPLTDLDGTTQEAAQVTNHDPGDEHTEPVKNPSGGGYETRCRPGVDAYDGWKPGRDVVAAPRTSPYED